MVMPLVEVSPAVPFNDPVAGQGYSFQTTVTTGLYVPPPRQVLLGSADQTGLPAGMGAHRTYYGMGNKADMTRALQTQQADDKALMISLLSVGPGPGNPVYDTAAMEGYRPALEAPNVTVIPLHEPEDNNIIPAYYQAFYNGMTKQFPNARVFCPVLMASTYNNGNFRTWLANLTRIDAVGVDGYNRNDGRMPAAIFDTARLYAESIGKKLVIAETGAVTEPVQLAYLDALQAYAAKYPSVQIVCYWNSKGPLGDYRLSPAGVSKFAQLLKSPPFAPIQYL